MMDSVTYGSTKIDFSLKYADRKTMGIKVHPDSSVVVLSPLGSDIKKIREKVKTKAAWILKQQDFFLSFHPLTPARKYLSGETHLYLGKQYRLKLIESKDNLVKLKSGYMEVHTSDISDKVQVEKMLKGWYREKADNHFSELFLKCVEGSKIFKSEAPSLKYRWMSKRWGSCDAKGIVHLNTELIKAKKEYIEYVIIHELCHLIQHNHSSNFYKLLEQQLPSWRTIKDKLERLMV